MSQDEGDYEVKEEHKQFPINEPENEIKKLINEINGHINADRIQEAADTYNRILNNLNYAKDLRILPYILEISKIKEHLNKELEYYFNPNNFENKINSLIEKCRRNLRIGKVSEAKTYYDEAFEIFSKIPADFIQHKSSIGAEIVELYKGINIGYLKILNVKAIEVKDHISQLLKTGHNYLAKKNFKGAFDIYARCVEALSEFPSPFLKKRFNTYNELFDFYKEISLKADVEKLQGEIKEQIKP